MKRNIVLIGNGYWGSIIKKYIPEFFHLKYTADSKTDLKEIWKDKTIEAVIIATPIETHYMLTKEALLNRKHVYVEKPVTTVVSESEEIKKLSKDMNVYVCVEYTQTFSPSIKKIVSVLKDWEPIKYIEMSVKHLGRFLNHDVYWLLASHQLSILGSQYDLDLFKFKNSDHLYYNNLCTSGTIFFESTYYNLKGKIDVSINFPGKEIYANFYSQNSTVKYEPLTKKSVKVVKYNNSFHALPPELTDYEKEYNFDEKNNLQESLKYFKDVMDGERKSNLDLGIKVTKVLVQFANIYP